MDWREDLDFEIGWTRNNLRILGIWPDSGRPGKDSLFYRYKFLIPSMLMLIYIILPQTLYLFFAWGDLEHCVDALLTADVPILTALIKFLSFSYHREAINSIVSFVTEDWKRPKSREERETMMRNAKIARGISLRISILLYLAMAAHVASHIATEVRRRLSNDTNLEPQVLLRGYYPFDTKKSPNYELLSFMQLISGIGGALSYSNVDSFVGATILHVCAQFSNLRFLAAKMLRKAEKQEPLEFRKTLRIIVERHTSLTWVTLVIEECFNKMFLAQVIACIIQVCFPSFLFLVTVSTGEKETLVLRSIFFIVFTGAMLVHFFVYCYVGEMLYGQSAGLCDTLYESNWYEMPPENIRDLMVIMVATKKPIYITAGKFFPFLFDTFTNVLKSSMGYLSVLVAMRDRLVEA